MRNKRAIHAAAAFLLVFTGTVTAATLSLAGHGQQLSCSETDGRVTELAASGASGTPLKLDTEFQIFVQQEGEKEGAWLPFSAFKLVEPPVFDQATLALSSRYSGTDRIDVRTVVSLKPDNTAEWKIEVTNRSAKPILRVRYPVFHNLVFSPDGAQDELFWPCLTTVLVPNPAGTFFARTDIINPVHYPRASVNFTDLSGGGRGLTVVGDPSLIMNEYGLARGQVKGSLDLRIDRVNTIPPGGRAAAVYTTYQHTGTWRQGADFYRAFFYRHFPKPNYPAWVRQANGYLAGYWGSDFPPPYGSETRFQINETWRLGLNHLQFWGQTGTHACPGYPLADPLRGGEKGMTAMFHEIRRAGLHTGGYFWSCGIGKFEVLAKSYRGVPWTDLPAEVRPPSWQWMVENSAYPTSDRTAPDTTFQSNAWKRANVKTVEEAEAKKLTPQSLHTLTFLSPGFRNWLMFWSERYVDKYGADVIYLDVFGWRPKNAEYNPYLKKFGDGTEGQYRRQFLETLTTDLREREPSLVPFMEGIMDAYAVYAAGLVSNFRRFMDGYRYTFPDHILYEGNGNGQIFEEYGLRSVSNAFLDGNRFDLITPFCSDTETEQIVWLRDSLMPWITDGTYRGAIDFSLSSAKLEGKLIDGEPALGSVLINLRNIQRAKGETLTLAPELLRRSWTAAFLLETSGRARKITDISRPIGIPGSPVSALLLAQPSPSRPLLPVVIPEMKPAGLTYRLCLVNLGAGQLPVKLDVQDAETGRKLDSRSWRIPGDACQEETYTLPETAGADRTKRLLFAFTWTGGKNPPGGRTAVLRRTWDPPIEDPHCEWRTDISLSREQVKDGRSAAKITQNYERAYLKLAPNTPYRIQAASWRDGTEAALAAVSDPRKRQVVTYLKETPATRAGAWGEVTGDFTTGPDGWLVLHLYNKGKSPVYYDDIRVTPR